MNFFFFHIVEICVRYDPYTKFIIYQMFRGEKTESIIVSIASGRVTVIIPCVVTVIILLYKLEYMIKNPRGLLKY